MTSLEIIEKVDDIFRHQWNEENALSVPEAESVALISNHAKLIDGTVLYADLNDSTALVDGHKHWFAAEIYKSYLLSASQIIKDNNGEITAFDGDRVMGVFIGDRKNSSAVKAALQINFIVMKINDKIKERYPDSTYKLKQSIGIDTSKLFVARTGVRKYNDLVWVGRAANYAAKLCGLTSNVYSVSITNDVFKMLSEDKKFGGTPRRSMWTNEIWLDKGINIFRSSWHWTF